MKDQWYKIILLGDEVQKRIKIWKKFNNKAVVSKSIRLSDNVKSKILERIVK